MKTKIKYCLMGGLIAASLTGFNSCQLESEIYDSINAGMFPQTEADAEAMVTANGYGVFQSNGYGGMFNVANGIPLIWTLQEHWVKTRKRTTSSTAMRTY